jgi:hypothetical protein
MKKVNFKYPEKLRKISTADRRELSPRFIKLFEEAGEAAAEYLKLTGHKGRKGKTRQETLDHLRLELVDCLIMTLDLLVATKTSEEQVSEIMTSQLDKWSGQLKNK